MTSICKNCGKEVQKGNPKLLPNRVEKLLDDLYLLKNRFLDDAIKMLEGEEFQEVRNLFGYGGPVSKSFDKMIKEIRIAKKKTRSIMSRSR